jgi:hypothetical protein
MVSHLTTWAQGGPQNHSGNLMARLVATRNITSGLLSAFIEEGDGVRHVSRGTR